jgi:hypothetical protein
LVALKHHTDKGKPAGPFSIGRALEIPAGAVNDDLCLAVEAVDRVHGVGHLPRIPMEFRSQLGMNGRFEFDETTGEPIRILIDRRAPHRTFVAIHEIGHFLDLAAFGDGLDFGSRLNPMMADWLETVARSGAYGRFAAAVEIEPSVELLDLIGADELWARAYAQYVAIRSGSQELLNGLDTWQGSAESLHIPLQREDNDFVDIATAIEEMFTQLGWRT